MTATSEIENQSVEINENRMAAFQRRARFAKMKRESTIWTNAMKYCEKNNLDTSNPDHWQVALAFGALGV